MLIHSYLNFSYQLFHFKQDKMFNKPFLKQLFTVKSVKLMFISLLMFNKYCVVHL